MSDDTHIPLGLHGYEFLDEAPAALPEDAEFDRWLARETAAVNVPGPTPHAEMWAAIAAAQPAQTGTIARVLPFRSRRWAGAAMLAAALLIGIGIDRLLVRGGTDASRNASPAPGASPTATRVDSLSHLRQSSPMDAGIEAPRVAVRPPASVSQPGGSITSPAAPGRATATPSADAPAAGNLYRLAAVQTLSQAEALLTAYRASGVAERDPAAARQLGRWGRDVLSSTRLLLDSPAGDDPEMRPLLNDLELVLVQIIRLSGAPLDASERALIDRSLRERDLLPRIHTAVPAGTIGTASDD